MLNLKKTEITLIILLIIFISGFFLIQNPSFIAKLFLFEPKATQQGVGLNITISGCEEEDINATLSGEANSISLCNSPTITSITNIPAGSNIKIRVYTNSTTPDGFTAPSTTTIRTVLKYITITLNTTLTGTAKIYFNITQSDLGSIDADDIGLYKYTTSWTELTTVVINGTLDPASFYAVTPSFSNFIIGEKAPGLPSVTTPLAAGGISRGGRGIEKPAAMPKPVIIKPIPERVSEIAKKVIEKIIKLPEFLIRYKVSYNVIYIIATSLILLVIILEIIYYYIQKKK